MNWSHNAIPFVPSLALNDDWTDYSIETLKELCMGSPQMLQITLSDNSMYDRYYKDDMVNIKAVKEIPESGDALIVLPDDSVIFRCYERSENSIKIFPYYEEFEEAQTYDPKAVTIVGIATKVVRIN